MPGVAFDIKRPGPRALSTAPSAGIPAHGYQTGLLPVLATDLGPGRLLGLVLAQLTLSASSAVLLTPRRYSE